MATGSWTKTILSGIPGAIYHDGGTAGLGPDEKSTSPRATRRIATARRISRASAEKILRLNDDGSIPKTIRSRRRSGPMATANPQGLAWGHVGDALSTEHGRSGITTGYDELNRIEKGKNYGWPKIQGPETALGWNRPSCNPAPILTFGLRPAPPSSTAGSSSEAWKGEAAHVPRHRQSRPQAIKATPKGNMAASARSPSARMVSIS